MASNPLTITDEEIRSHFPEDQALANEMVTEMIRAVLIRQDEPADRETAADDADAEAQEGHELGGGEGEGQKEHPAEETGANPDTEDSQDRWLRRSFQMCNRGHGALEWRR